MTIITLSHPTGNISGRFHLPASKSISNRLLVIRALAGSQETILNLSDAEDTLLMQKALETQGGIVDIKNAGTCMRFLAAYFSCTPCDVILKGNERMNRRPVGDLVNTLKQLGADINYLGEEGFPPLAIKGKKLRGGRIAINASQSSQFVTALMLVAPTLLDGLEIEISGDPASRSYIKMTERLMYDAGIVMSRTDKMIGIPPQEYKLRPMVAEADWSAASYWFEIAALSKNCEIILTGLKRSDLQGDYAIAAYMERFGVTATFSGADVVLTRNNSLLKEVAYNMSEEPDLVPAMAVTLAALNTDATFDQIANLRIKESDRIAALEAELGKCGFDIETTAGSIRIKPVKVIPGSPEEAIDTYGDHRIAMAFAPLALLFDEVKIADPDVVIKSYPMFWNELRQAGFIIR